MTIKKVLILMIIGLFLSTSVFLYVLRENDQSEINLVEVNDIVQSLSKQWQTLDDNNLPGLAYGLDYVVLDHNNEFITATSNGLNNNLNTAIKNRDTIVDIESNGEVIGKLIIYNDTNRITKVYKTYLFSFTMLIVTINTILCLLYALYIKKAIFKPFNKLQNFARHVAQGNLDMPLEMDKGNMFGAFTESFDLMREELYKARENERIANQSKKEIVASLSHDIKTPVASIKAVSELMYAKSQNDHDKKQLMIVNSKADQIDTLITNIFNATLEELQELKVTVSEESSEILCDLIRDADYYHRVTITNTFDCIVLMDVLRLSQVIDNVISNSYKYAGTSISVSIHEKDEFLEIIFKDYGQGVLEDERPFIFNKYYRAINSEGKSGSGLGLYISRYLMKKMSGDMDCENTHDGFIIILKLRIV